jgi:hypothetical protein
MASRGLTFLSCIRLGFAVVSIPLVLLSFSSTAFAQSSSKVESLDSAKASVPPSEGLSFNLPASPDISAQMGPRLELPVNAVGSTLFKLDLTNPACTNGTGTCLRRADQMDLGLTDTFRRRSENGLDLSLTPRASVRFDDEISSTAVGAVLEIGEDLRTGNEFKNNTWYFFAGADAEALTYSPNSVGRITSGEFHLQDRIIVGDAQAGLGYRIGDADVSLSYMRREASTEEFSYKEDAAALSFTWKR